ncbi:MAG TPA: BrnT family toxin [Acidobacteriaceae bacterium]
MGFAFEYDSRKAASNLKKHGVSFREAMTVFDDPMAQTFPDDLHSEDESRSITIGLSSRQRLLFLSHLEGTTTSGLSCL